MSRGEPPFRPFERKLSPCPVFTAAPCCGLRAGVRTRAATARASLSDYGTSRRSALGPQAKRVLKCR